MPSAPVFFITRLHFLQPDPIVALSVPAPSRMRSALLSPTRGP